EFAVAVSFGVFTTAFLSLFLLPAIFSLLKDPSELHLAKAKDGALTLFLGNFSLYIDKFKYIFILTFAVIVLITIKLLPNLDIGSDYYKYFPKNDPVIDELKYVSGMTGGNMWYNLTLEVPQNKGGFFGTQDGLVFLSNIENELRDNIYVYDVVSIVTYLKKMNVVLNNQYEVPQRVAVINLFKRIFSKMITDENKMFKEVKLMENDYNKVTFVIRIFDKNNNQPLAEKDFPLFMDSIKDTVSQIEHYGFKTKLWGWGLVASTISGIVLNDQFITLIISFLLVFTVTCIFFKSIYYGLVVLVPLITAICTNYLFLVILNIPLDLTTIMVSSVAIGVGVDDSIHFLIQYRQQIKLFPNDHRKVLYNTFMITGRPIVLTSVSIVAGLLVLLFASFVPITYFGLLVSLSLIGALIGTLIFLPALLSIINGFFSHRNNKCYKG
ncbi:MAG: MMPL family transporter, partial [Spirochaetales bacterium]|nr:MMPL family transporter [Spirochaetales bacterium]